MQATENKVNAQASKSTLGDGEFNAYARSGMLVNNHGKGGEAALASPCQLVKRRCACRASGQ
jgi:hypothetical protein